MEVIDKKWSGSVYILKVEPERFGDCVCLGGANGHSKLKEWSFR